MKKIILLMVVAIFMAGSIAHADPIESIFGTSLTRKSSRLARKLEMAPFVLGTDRKDQCAIDQVHRFLENWRHQSSEEKQFDVYASRAIHSLSIGPTIQSGVVTGARSVLSFVVCSQGRRDRCTTISKIIGDNLVLSGSSPRTKFSKSTSQDVILTAEFLRDNHVSVYFVAESRSVYDRITSAESLDFVKTFADGNISRGNEIVHDEPVCGSVPLMDLVKAFLD